MYAHAVFPLMETLNSLAGTTQRVAAWTEAAKKLMLSDALKGYSDWEFVSSVDIDESANNIRSGVGTFYGCVIAYNAATAGGDLLCVTNDTSNTFSGAAALDAGDFLAYSLPAAATEDTEEFHTILIPSGFYFDTGLTVGADAQGGTNPGTDDVRGWFLYRTAA